MILSQWVDFHWLGLVFWILVGLGLLFLFIGVWKKSGISLFISALAFLLPSIYFIGAESWPKLFTLTPLIPLFLIYITRKKVKGS